MRLLDGSGANLIPAPLELPIRSADAARLSAMETGDRMLIWCEGGPSMGRAVHFPPPLEIAVDGGMYVLVDDGPPEGWHYTFLSEADLARSHRSA